MVGKQREEERGGAIVEVVEGVADRQPQRPFSCLKEALFLMVQSAELLQLYNLFFFLISAHRGGAVAPQL